jgi:hypothetical protein
MNGGAVMAAAQEKLLDLAHGATRRTLRRRTAVNDGYGAAPRPACNMNN